MISKAVEKIEKKKEKKKKGFFFFFLMGYIFTGRAAKIVIEMQEGRFKIIAVLIFTT